MRNIRLVIAGVDGDRFSPQQGAHSPRAERREIAPHFPSERKLHRRDSAELDREHRDGAAVNAFDREAHVVTGQLCP